MNRKEIRRAAKTGALHAVRTAQRGSARLMKETVKFGPNYWLVGCYTHKAAACPKSLGGTMEKTLSKLSDKKERIEFYDAMISKMSRTRAREQRDADPAAGAAPIAPPQKGADGAANDNSLDLPDSLKRTEQREDRR